MAYSQAEAGKFAVFEVGDTNIETIPTTWAAVGEVIGDIGISAEREQLEVTSHSSGIWADQISGRVSPISATFTINSVTDDIELLWNFFKFTGDSLGNAAWFRILYPFGYRHRFAANVAGMNTVAPLDGAVVTTEVTLGVRLDVFWEIND